MNQVSRFSASSLKSLVGVDGELKSLNDLWKLAGSPKNRDPKFWLRINETIRYIDAECKREKVIPTHLLRVKRGRKGGTYASNRILLEYARYLDKDLAVVVNEVFLQEVVAQQNPDMYLDKYRNAYKRKGKDDAWINERMKGVGIRKELTATLGTHGVHDNGFRECTNASYTGLFGMNAPAIRSALNIEKKDSIRDNLDKTQLLALSLSESLANDDIKGRKLWGVEQCSQSCHDAAHTIYGAVMKFKQR
jgi:hypothetical protein